MQLKIHAVNFEADRKLIGYVQRRVNKLQHFNGQLIDGEVFLKLSNRKDLNKTVEIRLHLPGHRLFAAEKSRRFETACNRSSDSIKKQMEKLKTRLHKGRA